MGPGHFAFSFAVKPGTVRAPLWLLLLSTEVLDLLSLAFVALGFETFSVTQTDLQHGLQVITPGYIAWSHGLFMSVGWSILAGIIAYAFSKDTHTSGIMGLLVFSHWFLDFIVHPQDLPLFFNYSPQLGLGLWTTGPGMILSIILELVLIGGGIAIYLNSRRSKKEGTIR